MKFLLVTDLDHTLVGDDQALLSLNQKLIAARPHLGLIYATGRSYASARRLQQEVQLLEPDYWVTGVGTEIYQQGERDLAWAEQLSQGWHREQIIHIAQAFPDLVPQPNQEQNPWKISFFLRSYQAEQILAELRHKLAQADITAQVIFSSNRDVDILPISGDKGLAMTHLRQKMQVPSHYTLVCGDSGNDISLFQQNTLGVIVGNAQPELRQWQQKHSQPQHYQAQSNYAWGILEALFYFKLL